MFTESLKQASSHLAAADPVLAKVIAVSPLPDFTPHTDYYRALARSIIGQQLSVKAAATINERFVSLFEGTFPTPEQIVSTDIETLRTAGLSGRKASYIRDLAQHVIDGEVQFETLDRLSNQEIIKELTAVKGIGEWTVHMFLLFCMGRLDVLATGDFGIRSGIKLLYGLNELPTPADVQQIAAKNHWSPYESVACWYVWRALDNAPK